MEQAKKRIEEFKEIDPESLLLPDCYKKFFLANKRMSMDARPFEYFSYAMMQK